MRNLSFHLNQTSSLWPSVGVRCRPLLSPPPDTIHKALLNISAFISCLIALILKILIPHTNSINRGGPKNPLLWLKADNHIEWWTVLIYSNSKKKFCLLSISFWREGNGITFSGILIICLCPTVWAELNQSIHTQSGEVEMKIKAKNLNVARMSPSHYITLISKSKSQSLYM